MSNLRLYWNTYRYFPYEKDLAIREAQAVLGVPAVEADGGLTLDCDAEAVARAERLTYFRAAVGTDVTVVPDQALLEASGNGGAVNGNTDGLPGPRLRRQVTRYSAHGLHEYRGKYNPQIVRAVGNTLGMQPGQWVLDPFCGSGTTLLEAAHIGWNAAGVDVNPLGVLMANAKLAAFRASPKTLVRESEAIGQRLNHANADSNWRNHLPETDYLAKWFPEPVLAQLSSILVAIKRVTPAKLRPVFQVILSDICREVSLQDPGDLRIRRRKDAAENYPAIEMFLKAVETKTASVVRARAVMTTVAGIKQRAFLEDCRSDMPGVRKMLSQAGKEGFDGAITSPPYATAMPYIDTQRLSLVLLGLISAREIRAKERALIGNREIQNRERLEAEAHLLCDEARLPKPVITFCRHLLDLANHRSHGFRRRNVPALVYKYLAEMAEMFSAVGGLVQRGGCFALLAGQNATTLRGRGVTIDTPQLLADVAASRGWGVDEMISFETYHRYDVHQRNSVRREVLVVLRNERKE